MTSRVPKYKEGDRVVTNSHPDLIDAFRNQTGTVQEVEEDPLMIHEGHINYAIRFDTPIKGRESIEAFYVAEEHLYPVVPPLETVMQVEAFLNG